MENVAQLSDTMTRFMQGCTFRLKRDKHQRTFQFIPSYEENPFDVWGKVYTANGVLHCHVSELWNDPERMLFHANVLDQPCSVELSVQDVVIL